MRHRLFTIFAAISALLCVAEVLLWVRDSASARRFNDAYYVVSPNPAGYGVVALLTSVVPLAWVANALKMSRRR